MDASKSGFDWSSFHGDRFTAEKIGDTISGTVVGLRVEDGRSGRVPVLTLAVDDGSTREVWAGAFDLCTKLAENDVQVNNRIEITFTGEKHTGQASPMKLFEVDVDHEMNNEPF